METGPGDGKTLNSKQLLKKKILRRGIPIFGDYTFLFLKDKKGCIKKKSINGK